MRAAIRPYIREGGGCFIFFSKNFDFSFYGSIFVVIKRWPIDVVQREFFSW